MFVLQAKKERAVRNERGYQPVNDFSFPAREKINAFKPKREPPEPSTTFILKEHKHLPFKQMVRLPDESEKAKIHPRMYTRIVDSIYSYSKGKLNDDESSTTRSSKRGHEPIERLLVTPATAKDEVKDDYNRHRTFLPPLS